MLRGQKKREFVNNDSSFRTYQAVVYIFIPNTRLRSIPNEWTIY
jgi:hypothetical protein